MNAASYHVYVYWCILHLGIDWESKYSEGAALTSFSMSNYHIGSGFCSLWRGAGTVLFLLVHPSALLSLSFIPSTFIYIYILSRAQRLVFSFTLFFYFIIFFFLHLSRPVFLLAPRSFISRIFRLLSVLLTPSLSHLLSTTRQHNAS